VLNVQAKYQMDHYIPKADFPCFSISLYNLYPVCAYCNNCKGKKSVYFDLYKANHKITGSQYSFTLNAASRAKYLRTRNIDDLKIAFKEPRAKRGYEKFEKLYNISGIYETQKDLVEELIKKRMVYTQAYKTTLLKQFSHVFSNPKILNRLILGNYIDESEIHNRPMSKFMQDVARQIGLI
jgi:hypothetical protein